MDDKSQPTEVPEYRDCRYLQEVVPDCGYLDWDPPPGHPWREEYPSQDGALARNVHINYQSEKSDV